MVRDRWELDEPGPPDEPPARLAGLVLGIVRGAPLEPVATIETEREKRLIGAVEVSDDRVASSIDGIPGPSFRQIELEVKGSGARRLLKELSDRLIRAGAKPTTASKLETALGGQPEPEVAVPRLHPRSHLDTLVGYALARSVIRLVGEECLLWGSGYPRFDAPDPRAAFPAGLDGGLVERLLGGNARELYRVGVAV